VYYPPHSSWLFEEQPLDDGGVSVIGKVFLSDAKSNNVEEVRITFVRDDTGTWRPQGSSLKR
jgi:hypothetical protein